MSQDFLPSPLPPVARADAARLLHRSRALSRRARRGEDVSAAGEQLAAAWAEAAARHEQRAALALRLDVPPELPVAAHADELIDLFRRERVFVVCGETGSGKTTQLPKLALAAGRGLAGRIGHTQPRRIAARSVARRIAEELGPDGPKAVGHTVRFHDTAPPTCRIQVMTDGILLAATRRDPDLLAYDTILLDEAHERSLNIDFLLGYVRRLIERRDDLCVVITSATLDTERFAQHFDGAPVVEVSGRTYPVEVRWRPPGTDENGDPVELERAVAAAVRELLHEGPGDILVFLATAREIAEVGAHLAEQDLGPVDVMPLYARLPVEQQDRVFAPAARRRIVLSTNVAETSLTVPGIHYVVDTGRARVRRYSPHLRVQRLPIEAISQDSAAQRAGRCGRVADGVCIRLYDEDDFERRDRHTAPELLRSNLAGVILDMKALRLGAVEAFPFLDPPRPKAVREGYRTLFELAAVDEEGRLTDTGRTLSRLPLDPRLARLLLEGQRLSCADALRIVVAALGAGDPRERPAEDTGTADRAHARFLDPASDVMTLLKLHDHCSREEAARSGRGFRGWCRDHHLRFTRWREWNDVVRQLRDMTRQGDEDGPDARNPDRIHRALVPGMLSHVAMRGEGHAYHGTHDSTVWLWPGSVLFRERPPWIVSLERVETSRVYARMVAPVRRDWVEPYADHLVKRAYRDAHWSERHGHVYAYERVTLDGLVLEPRRRVHYGPIHPRRAREIFLRHALVHGRYRSRAAWRRNNERVLEDVRGWQARLRRTDLELDADDRFAFFDARVPAEVTGSTSFERWRAVAERDNARVLFLDLEALLGEPLPDDPSAWPDSILVDGVLLELRYRLAPGEESDGITVRVPLAALGRVRAERLEWLVPGWVTLKVEGLLRTLPKALRRPLVPLPETAAQLARELAFGQGSLRVALVHALGNRAGRALRARDFVPEQLPPHLLARIEVLDEHGAVLASGRDLEAVRREVRARRGAVLAEADREAEARASRTWAFGDLPDAVEVDHGGFHMRARPVLVDGGDVVRLAHVDPGARADRLHRRGVRRLLALDSGVSIRRRLEAHPSWSRLSRLQRTRGTPQQLAREIVDLVLDRAANLERAVPRDEASFVRVREAVRRGSAAALEESIHLVEAILERYDAVARKLMMSPPPGYEAPVDDMIRQLARLVEEDVFASTSWQHLTRVPRYLDAIDARLQRIGHGGLATDRRQQARLDPWLQRWREAEVLAEEEGLDDPALDTLRWALEEWRVALFAQELGTAGRISEARLDEIWEARLV